MTTPLTITHPDGTWTLKGHDIKTVPHELYGYFAKLHAYEKCGLNPDELDDLLNQLSESRFQKNAAEEQNKALKGKVEYLENKLADIYRFVEVMRRV